jgi:Ca2+-transporting ATPase
LDEKKWYSLDVKSVLESLRTGRQGLEGEEARRRFEEYGPNELIEEKKTTPIEIFLAQFKSILILILIVSALVSTFISYRKGEPYTDTYVILIIVVMNAILGFVQEYRAEKAVEALMKMVSPYV